MVNVDRTEFSILTALAEDQPHWSPDGIRIAYTTYSKTEPQVYIINADGTHQVKIIDKYSASPAWSPNGTQIALTVYSGLKSSSPRIYVVDVNTMKETQLTNEHSFAPIWSPDGKKIVYGCQKELCVMNSDGSGQTRLMNWWFDLNYRPSSPSWSPDGQYIVYWQHDPFCFLCPMTGQLWVMKADGSQKTKITDGPADQYPAWQPAP